MEFNTPDKTTNRNLQLLAMLQVPQGNTEVVREALSMGPEVLTDASINLVSAGVLALTHTIGTQATYQAMPVLLAVAIGIQHAVPFEMDVVEGKSARELLEEAKQELDKDREESLRKLLDSLN